MATTTELRRYQNCSKRERKKIILEYAHLGLQTKIRNFYYVTRTSTPRELDGQSAATHTSTMNTPLARLYTFASLPSNMIMRLKHESPCGKAPETRSISVVVVVVVLAERMVVVVLSSVILIVVVVVTPTMTSLVGAAVVVVVRAAVVVIVGADVVIVVVVVGAALVVVVVVVTQITRVSAGSVPGEASPTQVSNDGM